MSGARVFPMSDDDAPTAELGTPGSLVARLRSRAKEVQEERRLDLPVPGWRGDLVLRFRPLDITQLERVVDRQAKGGTSYVSEGIDAMATCCVGVLGRDSLGVTLTALEDAEGPVRIEHRLGVLLGMPVPPDAELSTREVVLMLFGGNAFALGSYLDRFVSWMIDPDATEPPGES